MGNDCKTCTKAINANKKNYTSVACNCNMHLTPEYTNPLPAAITDIKELGMNAILLCNSCAE